MVYSECIDEYIVLSSSDSTVLAQENNFQEVGLE